MTNASEKWLVRLRRRLASYRNRSAGSLISTSVFAGLMAVGVFYSSLVATSFSLNERESVAVEQAIQVLERRGFAREAFVLRGMATFRRSDHWLNEIVIKENSYAATNFPVQVITLYPDFFTKAEDDTERAMVLLHEARHLLGQDEAGAYAYVWRNRGRLGWTQLTHGTTATYVTIADQTREFAPELFTCADRLWSDCTETMLAYGK